MGLLDDAIRQHLELKRTHGASEEEIARQEAEALGPARRVSSAQAPRGEGAPPDEDASFEESEPGDPGWVPTAGEPDEPDRAERPSLLERGLSLFRGPARDDQRDDDLDQHEPGHQPDHDDELDRADPLGDEADGRNDLGERRGAYAAPRDDAASHGGDPTEPPDEPAGDTDDRMEPQGARDALAERPSPGRGLRRAGADRPDLASADAERAEFTSGGGARSAAISADASSEASGSGGTAGPGARVAGAEPTEVMPAVNEPADRSGAGAEAADRSPAGAEPADFDGPERPVSGTPRDNAPRRLMPADQPSSTAEGNDDLEGSARGGPLRPASDREIEERIHRHADEEVAAPHMDSSGEALTDFVPSPPPPERDERPDEDLLEETPDFLQETPEHERLWFEQKPPRDFDFDD